MTQAINTLEPVVEKIFCYKWYNGRLEIYANMNFSNSSVSIFSKEEAIQALDGFEYENEDLGTCWVTGTYDEQDVNPEGEDIIVQYTSFSIGELEEEIYRYLTYLSNAQLTQIIKFHLPPEMLSIPSSSSRKNKFQ